MSPTAPDRTGPITDADITRPDFGVGTIAEEKLADPEGTPGTASDYRGTTDSARTVRQRQD